MLAASLMDDPIVSIPTATAAILVAYGIIYRKGLRPATRFAVHFVRSVQRIADSTPVLIEIAEEFRTNGGNSLRDVVNSIETKVDAAVRVAEDTRATVESKLDAHLALPAWHNERESILARLASLEKE